MPEHRVMQNISGGCVPFRSSSYASAVLADTPVAYWQYQECSGMPIDSSGNSRDMTSVTSGVGLAYRQTGALSDVRDKSIFQIGGSAFERSSPVSTVTNGFTLEMWVKVELVTNNDQILIYNGNSGADGWGVLIDTDFKYQYLAGGVAFGTAATTALTVNTWHHIALKRSTTWTYYLDGSPNGTGGTTTPNTPTTKTRAGDGSVQRYQSHIAIYEAALTDAQIAAHYAAA